MHAGETPANQARSASKAYADVKRFSAYFLACASGLHFRGIAFDFLTPFRPAPELIGLAIEFRILLLFFL